MITVFSPQISQIKPTYTPPLTLVDVGSTKRSPLPKTNQPNTTTSSPVAFTTANPRSTLTAATRLTKPTNGLPVSAMLGTIGIIVGSVVMWKSRNNSLSTLEKTTSKITAPLEEDLEQHSLLYAPTVPNPSKRTFVTAKVKKHWKPVAFLMALVASGNAMLNKPVEKNIIAPVGLPPVALAFNCGKTGELAALKVIEIKNKAGKVTTANKGQNLTVPSLSSSTCQGLLPTLNQWGKETPSNRLPFVISQETRQPVGLASLKNQSITWFANATPADKQQSLQNLQATKPPMIRYVPINPRTKDRPPAYNPDGKLTLTSIGIKDKNLQNGSDYLLDVEAAEAFKKANALFKKETGMDISVISAYRDEARNRRVGGAVNSLHLSARAIDLDNGIIPKNVTDPVAIEKLRTEKRRLFKYAVDVLEAYGFRSLRDVMYNRLGTVQSEENHLDFIGSLYWANPAENASSN